MSSPGAISPATLAPGTQFAGYRIEDVVGRGGMGVVYRAVDTTLDRTVALKLIAPQLTADPLAVARFKSEAKLAASLDHPNIVTVYGAGECDGVLYLAMRFVPGTTVQAVVDSHGALELSRTRRIIGCVASALDAAHASGLVHRDVKPGNILLSGDAEQERVYLTDFGLTKRLGATTGGLTRSGNWVGTPDYSSPEQIRGQPVDFRTDVYSLGCVVYELLTGEPPYVAETAITTMWAHANDPPPSPSKRRAELLPVFDALVAHAMAKQPSERFPTAGALAEALDRAVGLQLLSDEQKRAPATVAGADAAAALADPEVTAPSEAATEPLAPRPRRTAAERAEPGTRPRMPATRTVADSPAETADPVQPPLRPSAVPAESAPPAATAAPARRRRSLAVIAGTLVALAAVAGLVLAITLPGATTAHHAAHTSPALAHAPAPTLAQDVGRLNDIVRLFITGKRLSHVEHRYAAAARNRQIVLEQLAAFQAPPALRPAAQTLRAMTADSLAFNRDMAAGEFSRARGPDNAHNALRPQFVTEFNPYAERYLGHPYTSGDF